MMAMKKLRPWTFLFKEKKQCLANKFRQAMQLPSETFDTYRTKLKMLAKDCEFADEDKEIIAQIIQRCSSSRLCRRALREPDMTLTDLLVLGRMLESSKKQAKGIEEKAAAAVNALHLKSSK